MQTLILSIIDYNKHVNKNIDFFEFEKSLLVVDNKKLFNQSNKM